MKYVWLVVVLGFALAVGTPVATAAVEDVCPAGDSGKIDTPGEPLSVTVTAPAGFLIDSYCVKAGSENQGDGPVVVDVVPPAAEVTITYPGGKEISHYSYTLVEIAEEPPPTPGPNPTPSPTPNPQPTPGPTPQPTPDTPAATPTENLPETGGPVIPALLLGIALMAAGTGLWRRR
jgi:LPXTG-motif cell wall-anchored protein